MTLICLYFGFPSARTGKCDVHKRKMALNAFDSDELANFLMPMIIYVYGGLLIFFDGSSNIYTSASRRNCCM